MQHEEYAMSGTDNFRKWSEGWLARLTALGFLAISIGCAVVIIVMTYTGGPWAHIFYSEHPLRFLLGGASAWFASHLIRRGIHYGAADWRKFAGKILLAMFSMALSLAIAEFGLRVFLSYRQSANSIEKLKEYRAKGTMPRIRGTHPLIAIIEPSDNDKLIYRLQPGLNANFGHHSLRTNSEGLRSDREYSTTRLPNSIRIIGIGDSGMFGWNTDQNSDYMIQLETLLNKRGDGITYETINMGIPGYNTQQEVEMLRYKGLTYKPDIVIVGWCENDYDLPFCMAQEQNFRRKDMSFLYELMFRREHFADVALNQIHDQRTFDSGKEPEYIRAGSGEKGVEAALSLLKRMGEKENFRVLVFGPMKETIVGICKRVGIDFFNTHEKVPDTYPESYKVHAMHPSPDGHRVLAEHLAKALEERNWLKPN
jgi:hypothetical protein